MLSSSASTKATLTGVDQRPAVGATTHPKPIPQRGAASALDGKLVAVMRDAPLVIGMLGGMSWESSAQYYRLANEMVRERLGGLHSARIVLTSVDFADIEALQVAGRWDEAGHLLAEAAQGLEAAGADLLLICTNTMHKVADQVQASVGIPLLHLGDATAQAVTQAGLTTVGLLGTAFTMEQDFYRDRLTSHGLRVLIPPSQDRSEVHRIIYEELCLGVVREESRQVYRDAIVRLVQAGAGGIVLGCTEIELLISDTEARYRSSPPRACTSKPPLTRLWPHSRTSNR
jgi:aspartate racemase